MSTKTERFPHPGNHGDAKLHSPGVPPRFCVDQAGDVDTLRAFFELYYRIHGIADNVTDRIDACLASFAQLPQRIFGGGERRVFIIRSPDGGLVGGGELVIGYSGVARKEAYLCHKVLEPTWRGLGVGGELVRTRLRHAIAQGCVEAWSLVWRNDAAALRSLNRDGFVVRGNGTLKLRTDDCLNETYYVSREPLTMSEPRPWGPYDDVQLVQEPEQLAADTILIPFNSPELIDAAFARGYRGHWTMLPKDSALASEPMILMKRS